MAAPTATLNELAVEAQASPAASPAAAAITAAVRSKGGGAALQHAAVKALWWLATNASARANLVDAGAVHALWGAIESLAGASVQAAQQLNQPHADPAPSIDAAAARETPPSHQPAAGQPAEALSSRCDTLHCALSALAVLTVDHMARTALLDCVQRVKGPVLQPLLDLAALTLPDDVSAEGSSDEPHGSAIASEAAAGEEGSEGAAAVDNSSTYAQDAALDAAGPPAVQGEQGASASRADAAAAAASADTSTVAEQPADEGTTEKADGGSSSPDADAADTPPVESAGDERSTDASSETEQHRHREQACGLLVTLLRRDARAREAAVASGASQQIAELLSSPVLLVQLHAASCLATFAVCDDALRPDGLHQFAAKVDTIVAVDVLCGQLLQLEHESRVSNADALGNSAVSRSDLRNAFQAGLQQCTAAALAHQTGTDLSRLLLCLANTAERLRAAGPQAGSSLNAVTACLGMLCASKEHTEALLFSMQPLSTADTTAEVTALELTITTLFSVMDVPTTAQPHSDEPAAYHEHDQHSRASQATAAAALVTLALLPDQHTLPPASEAQFRGPFCELLQQAGLLPRLLALAGQPWQQHSMRGAVRSTVSAGVMALVATGVPLPHQQLHMVVDHAAKRSQGGDMEPAEYQMLAAALWLAVRHPTNCAHVAQHTALLHVATELAKAGVAHLLCFGTAGAPHHAHRVAQHGTEAMARTHFAWLLGSGEASMVKGLDFLVLLLWTLLRGEAGRAGAGLDEAICCYGRSNTAWWQMPIASKCVPGTSLLASVLCTLRRMAARRCT